MFTIIGLMLTGMLLGFLLRKQKLSGIHKVITVLIWLLLFLLGIDVQGIHPDAHRWFWAIDPPGTRSAGSHSP